MDEKQKKSLIFLHGWGITPSAYAADISALEERFNVVVPYFRGDKFEKNAFEVKKILDENGIGRAVVVGHSAGSITAILFAHLFPERVISIILVAPVGIGRRRSIYTWINRWIYHVFLFFFSSKRASLIFLLRLSRNFFGQMFSHLVSLYRETRAIMSTDLSVYYKEIQVPILLIWSKDDKIISKEIAENINLMNKNATVLFVSGDHDWIKLFPRQFLQEITRFLEKK